jgi:hypothetical protein
MSPAALEETSPSAPTTEDVPFASITDSHSRGILPVLPAGRRRSSAFQRH